MPASCEALLQTLGAQQQQDQTDVSALSSLAFGREINGSHLSDGRSVTSANEKGWGGHQEVGEIWDEGSVGLIPMCWGQGADEERSGRLRGAHARACPLCELLPST